MKQSSLQGFTLVELMVVIVIVAILASLIVVNIGSVDHRKVMQAREILLMDLQRIARESQDQSKILALSIRPAVENNSYQYEVLEYTNNNENVKTALITSDRLWSNYKLFNPRELPNHVSLRIRSIEHAFESAKNTELLNEQAPKLIWLGNGEVKPAVIQFYYNQQPIGAEIQINYMGKIHES